MDFKFLADDLLDRIEVHKNVLTHEQLLNLIEDTMYLVAQDAIREQNFQSVDLSEPTAELKVLLDKAQASIGVAGEYLQAAYLSASELERTTKEERYVAAKLNLVDIASTVSLADKQICFIKKQTNLE